MKVCDDCKFECSFDFEVDRRGNIIIDEFSIAEDAETCRYYEEGR